MNAQLKADWLKALRSGEYKQTRGQLRDGNCFCCLGVLCHVSRIGRWGWDSDHYTTSTGMCLACLPRALHREIGDAEEKLATMNDAGKTFAEIADWIEEHL